MRVVVDASCNAQGEFRYDEFGQQETSSQPPAALSAHAYVGGLGQRNEMAGLGLYYARHRWYASDLGRWLSADPIGFAGGLNLFEYVGSSPLDRVDPQGLQPPADVFDDGGYSKSRYDLKKSIRCGTAAINSSAEATGQLVIEMFDPTDPWNLVPFALGKVKKIRKVFRFLEVTKANAKLVKNLPCNKRIEFIFDGDRLLIGRMKHPVLVREGKVATRADAIYGGTIRNNNGVLLTDELSGHYGTNWNNAARSKFAEFLKELGITATHTPYK